MKITPHTIFIYSSGPFLRIVRGEHQPASTTIKPRVYKNLVEALANEHRPRIVNALKLFPSDKLLDRRLKVNAKPVKVAQHRTLADSIKSPLFTFAQLGRDSQHRDVGYVYHRSPTSSTGVVRAGVGKAETVRKLLKKYKRPPLRDLDYEERKPKLSTQKVQVA
jgi:hypothetical protein